MKYIAHIDKSFQVHDLEDHLQSVANMTKSKLPLNLQYLGYVAGLWHDLGKYRDDFQGYISVVSGYDTTKSYNFNNKSHSSAGMFLTKELVGTSPNNCMVVSAIQYVIGCHHTGLLDGQNSNGGRSLITRLLDSKYQQEYFDVVNKYNKSFAIPFDNTASIPCSAKLGYQNLQYSLAVRMLFSAMVDSDFTDTALFMNKYRQKHMDYKFKHISELTTDINAHMYKLQSSADCSNINTIRASVLKDCMAAAQINHNVFTLSVPTGGGKTLAGMAFALNHAAQFNKDRVIISIPYTSIIEQNAKVYKDIFGEGNVLEHHSNIDTDDRHLFNPHLKLASENWKAPIIVTTNVQLFESLFANRTSKCRKVHNIQNSVIILDEAQTIPTELLAPTLAYLRLLVEDYNVTLVFCTATQPCIKSITQPSGYSMVGFDNAIEIIKDTKSLYDSLNRVKIHLPSQTKESFEDIATKIASYDTALAVFSTRKNAQLVFDLVKDKSSSIVMHLSATMCPTHRTKKLDEVRNCLKNNIPVILISTQVVEAGVDIDFPIVFRAVAGLDSIAQAAGRCNREGKLEYGEVFLLNTDTQLPDDMRKPITITNYVFRDKYFDASNIIGETNIELFFKKKTLQDNLDVNSIIHNLTPQFIRPSKTNYYNYGLIDIKFETVAKQYRIIKEEDNNTIIVMYNNADELATIDLNSVDDIAEYMVYRLQKYAVVCRDKMVEKLLDNAYIKAVPGLYKTYMMINPIAYDDDKGLIML